MSLVFDDLCSCFSGGVNHRKGWELYDMSKHRNESEDLATRFPERLVGMVATFDTWFASLPKRAAPTSKKKQKKK